MTERTATTARLDGIAQQAALLFLDKGFDAASMSDLAAATGLGKSSLYHHLSSKDQLLAHICRQPLDDFRRELRAAADRPGSAGDRLVVALEQVTQISLADVAASHLVFTVKPTTDAAHQVGVERRQLERDLADLVAAAQAEGTARSDLDPALLTRLVVGTITGVFAWYRPETAEVSPDEISAAVLKVMLSAVEMR